MENNVFKRHLIRKLIVAGAFAVLTVAAIISITIVNAKVITPNEGFITAALVKIETGNAKNNMGDRLAVEIEQEGAVLAKNDDNVLPLGKDQKVVNVFGFNAYDWYISNSGSGSAGAGSAQKEWGILDALEDYGVEYNKDLINYYKNWSSKLDKSASYSSEHNTTYL